MKMKWLVVSAVIAICPSLTWASNSTFQNSCQNIRSSSSDEGVRISADCRKRNGYYSATSYVLRGIYNDNGQLRGRTGEPTSFHRSCRKIRLNWTSERMHLVAVCKDRQGNERESRLNLKRIENRDGRLVTASR